MTSIFDPVALGDIQLANRVVMGAMTRARAAVDGSVRDWTTDYYAQRASAGLIVCEGVFPDPPGKGYFGTPGIDTEVQIASWQTVTEAVHARGGKIYMQLMHCGRVGHPLNKDDGADHFAPSAVASDFFIMTPEGMANQAEPRALETDEVDAVLDGFERAAEHAKVAGFDGIELHSASGYLPHQFLAAGSNLRDDKWGGTPEKRIRFALEAVERLAKVFGAGRTGIKIAPGITYNGISDETEDATYGHLLKQLSAMDVAYLSFQTDLSYQTLAQGKINDTREDGIDLAQVYPYGFVREHYNGTVMASGNLTKELAQDALDRGLSDLFVFGRPYIANPDLVERMRADAPLAETDMTTVYSGGPEGYSDYPALDA